MGREVRRVPLDWQHPRIATSGKYEWQRPGRCRPVFMARTYREAKVEWDSNNSAWIDGTHEDLVDGTTNKGENPSYSDWNGGPPDPEYYRQREWAAEEATAYQVYETVSEGTPVSPVLPTREALIAWLTSPIPATERYPDLSVQGMSREQAERFAGVGCAPSFICDGLSIEMGAKAI